MALTVRNAVEALYRHLRKELRDIPYDDTSRENPFPDALLAVNATMQQMGAQCPLFASKQQRGVLFRPATTLTVTTQAQYSTTIEVTVGLLAWMKGCQIVLAGDSAINRILDYTDTTVTLQFAYLGTETSGVATVTTDCATLDADVIRVLEPVRTAAGDKLYPANGREELSRNIIERSDYGRVRVRVVDGEATRYFVESIVLAGDTQPRLRMMLSPAPLTALNVEFQARCSLGVYDSADVYGAGPGYADPNVAIPVPQAYVESIFLPLATYRFFSTPIMRDVNAPAYLEAQVQAAVSLMESMRPQGRKASTLYPIFG